MPVAATNAASQAPAATNHVQPKAAFAAYKRSARAQWGPMANRALISEPRKLKLVGPTRQATGPPRSGAGVGLGMLRGAGDSLT